MCLPWLQWKQGEQRLLDATRLRKERKVKGVGVDRLSSGGCSRHIVAIWIRA